MIRLRDVSKAYTVYERPRDVILEALLGGVRHDVFWALKDSRSTSTKGSASGSSARTARGKSTLLKLISGNLAPTSGSIEVNGTVSAMLALTSFLSQDETGLENIRFNLLLNGAPREEIPRLTEEVVEFTELGAFIHSPVRTYSSGMNARLAFAISTAVTPDILVVDEVLGAGDAYFASKATMRMIELTQQGRALLFVSHAMNAVQLLCDTAIWLDGGAIREIGPVDEVARRYEADFRRQEDEVLRSGNIARRAQLANRVHADELERPNVDRLRLTGQTVASRTRTTSAGSRCPSTGERSTSTSTSRTSTTRASRRASTSSTRSGADRTNARGRRRGSSPGRPRRFAAGTFSSSPHRTAARQRSSSSSRARA